jgi:hypothetical protein
MHGHITREEAQRAFERGNEHHRNGRAIKARAAWRQAAGGGHVVGLRNLAHSLSGGRLKKADAAADDSCPPDSSSNSSNPHLFVHLAAAAGDERSCAILGIYRVFEDRDLALARKYLDRAIDSSTSFTPTENAVLEFIRALTHLQEGNIKLRKAVRAARGDATELPLSLARVEQKLETTKFEFTESVRRSFAAAGVALDFWSVDLSSSERRSDAVAAWFSTKTPIDETWGELLAGNGELLRWLSDEQVTDRMVIDVVNNYPQCLRLLIDKVGRARFAELTSEVIAWEEIARENLTTLETLKDFPDILRRLSGDFWMRLAERGDKERRLLLPALEGLRSELLLKLFEKDHRLYPDYVSEVGERAIDVTVAKAALDHFKRFVVYLSSMGPDKVFATRATAATRDAIVELVTGFRRKNKTAWANLRHLHPGIDRYLGKETSLPRNYVHVWNNLKLVGHTPGETEGAIKICPGEMAQKWFEGQRGPLMFHRHVYISPKAGVLYAEDTTFCVPHVSDASSGKSSSFKSGFASMQLGKVVHLSESASEDGTTGGLPNSEYFAQDRHSTLVFTVMKTHSPFDSSDPPDTNHSTLVVLTRQIGVTMKWRIWICEDGRGNLQQLADIVRARLARYFALHPGFEACKIIPKQSRITRYLSAEEKSSVGEAGICYLLVCVGMYLILLLITHRRPRRWGAETAMRDATETMKQAFHVDLERNCEDTEEVTRTLLAWMLGRGWHRLSRHVWQEFDGTSLYTILAALRWEESAENREGQSLYCHRCLGPDFERGVVKLREDRAEMEAQMSDEDARNRPRRRLS